MPSDPTPTVPTSPAGAPARHGLPRARHPLAKRSPIYAPGRTAPPGAATPATRAPHRTPRSVPSLLAVSAAHLYALETLNRAASTIYAYRLVEERFVQFLRETRYGGAMVDPPITELTIENARGFVEWIKAGHSIHNLSGKESHHGSKTVHEHASALKSWARFCQEEGITRNHALLSLKLPRFTQRDVHLLTAKELRDFFGVVGLQALRTRDMAMYFLLLATGIRASELCGLKLTDLDLRSGRITVLGKGSRERTLPFDSATGRLLTAWLRERGDTAEPYVFLARTGRPYRRQALAEHTRDLGNAAGIPHCHPHLFRHAFATEFLRVNPGYVLQLQQLLGHAELAMVRRYARLAERDAALEGPSVVASLGLDKLARSWRV